jgi:hypothetical protein
MVTILCYVPFLYVLNTCKGVVSFLILALKLKLHAAVEQKRTSVYFRWICFISVMISFVDLHFAASFAFSYRCFLCYFHSDCHQLLPKDHSSVYLCFHSLIYYASSEIREPLTENNSYLIRNPSDVHEAWLQYSWWNRNCYVAFVLYPYDGIVAFIDRIA